MFSNKQCDAILSIKQLNSKVSNKQFIMQHRQLLAIYIHCNIVKKAIYDE